MFQKVLVVEELDCVRIGMEKVFEELSIDEIHYAKCCDDAFLRMKKAVQEESAFDLLISDLAFKSEFWFNRINSGDELIAAVKKIQPDIKTIVFSVEDKSYIIKSLFDDFGINSYVTKGRNSIPLLKKAIEKISISNGRFVDRELSPILAKKSHIDIEPYDISLLNALSKGLCLNEIAFEFKIFGIVPNGSSSIEKRINKLRIYFRARNNVQLIAIAKDLGLI